MAYDVKVNIDLAKPIGTVGFGVPLILIEKAEKAIPYTEVSNVDEAKTAGIDTESEAYKAAQLIFAQNHAPKKIAVCAVTTGAVAALNDVTLSGNGWRQLIVLSEGESDTAIADIITAVEALDGKLFFAGLPVNDSTQITVSGLRRTVLF